MARWLGFLIIIFLFTLGQVQAQSIGTQAKEIPITSPAAQKPAKTSPVLIVDEKEIVIKGWYGSGAGYFGSVRLTAKNEAALKPTFLSSDLTRQSDGMKVDRLNVATEGDIQLALETPKNIRIKVTGIEEPGTYKGKIEFRHQGAVSGKILDLTVIAKATQPLSPLSGSDQIRIHLTSGMWSASFLLPEAEAINSRQLQFKNLFQLPVNLIKADFVLNGEQFSSQSISTSSMRSGEKGIPL